MARGPGYEVASSPGPSPGDEARIRSYLSLTVLLSGCAPQMLLTAAAPLSNSACGEVGVKSEGVKKCVRSEGVEEWRSGGVEELRGRSIVGGVKGWRSGGVEE